MIDCLRTRRRCAAPAMTVMVSILAVSACGSGSHTSTTSTTSATIPKAQTLAAARYRRKLNAICLTLYRTQLPGGRAARLSAIVKAEGAAVSSMGALDPPAALAGLHRRAVAKARSGLVRMSKLTKEFEAGTITWPQLAARHWGPLISRETALWTRLGAGLCARGHVG